MRHKASALLTTLCVLAAAGCADGGVADGGVALPAPSTTTTTASPTSTAPTTTRPTTASPTTVPTTTPTTTEPSEPAPTGTASPSPTQTASPSPTQTSSPTQTPSPTPTETSDGLLERGDSGPAVLALQESLASLGYWLGTPDREFGDLTEQAVLALQGAAGLSRDGVAGPDTVAALDAGTLPPVRSAGNAVEIYLDRGLIVFVSDGESRRVLHTSTGTFEEYGSEGRIADTPRGEWSVTWAYDGWRTSDLGRLYRPRYFHRDGIAVHGYPSVPAYPASHGCSRVSLPAMDMIWREGLMPHGMPVIVI